MSSASQVPGVDVRGSVWKVASPAPGLVDRRVEMPAYERLG